MKCVIDNFGKITTAIIILAFGIYWFHYSMTEWYTNDFKIIGSGGKGKGAFVGVMFSTVMIIYGFYIIYSLKKCKKT